MNQMQSYGDVHQSHMSGPSHAQSSVTSTALAPYSHYGPAPPLLQPGPQSYTPQNSYGQYTYGNGVAPAPPGSLPVSNAMLPQPLPTLPSAPGTAQMPAQSYQQQHTFDTTGQIAPPGMKPRVTATLWEDEGSLCFQVEAKGVCVARREDNHMINGTKLLNVAGMTRGRRDGILKSEKQRHVVKIGPMHLKGVWIPFERALDFANKEKITEQLYPLFVHDIGALLYHPSNQPRAGVTGGAMAAVDRRRTDQRYIAAPQTSQPPSLHHHHSISNPMGGHISQPPHSIAPHPTAGRPILDRAHTFPTPPTSASSLIGMGSQGSSYEWSGTGVSGMQGNQPLSIDTGLSNARSVPTTPASTPPGNMQGMPQYQTSQGYDNTRPIYNSAPQNQQGQYGAQTQGAVRYGAVQPVSYPKSEMAPPARAGGPDQQTDAKPTEGMLAQAAEQVGHAPGDEEAEHEHDNEYTHTSASYGNNRSYGYNPNAPSGPMHAEHSHISTEMTGSPHQNGSGRATPRTTGTSQTQWTSGYSAPNRGQQAPSSNLYNVMSDTRSSNANGNTAPDAYSVSGSMTYPSQTYAATNGVIQSSKRGRDDDEEDSYGRPRTDSAADDIDGLKRRKTITESSGGGAIGSIFDRNGNGQLQRTRSAISQRRR